jgi:hypothetical protein
MDHLDFIKLLLDKGANVNHQIGESSETRTVFTNQWLDETGATAFLRASQSGDIELMKLLLSRGADPKINARFNVSALHVAAGIGWVEGITFEWSPKQTLEAVKMLLDLGLDPNLQAETGRVALHGAAHKRAVGDPAPRSGTAAAEADDREGHEGAADGPDARVDLYYGRLPVRSASRRRFAEARRERFAPGLFTYARSPLLSLPFCLFAERVRSDGEVSLRPRRLIKLPTECRRGHERASARIFNELWA